MVLILQTGKYNIFMFEIGHLSFAYPFFQGALAGYSDTAMRMIARQHGAPFAVTEALLDTLLINGGKGLKPAELDVNDHPIAGQIIGSEPAAMAKAAGILTRIGHDVIDVNLACPVRKIRRRRRGGYLMRLPEKAVDILDAVRQAVDPEVPCTVKMRRGFDDSPEAEADFYRIFEAVFRLGFSAVTIHPRTVKQAYKGPSDWDFLTRLVARYPEFNIFGSGDIYQAEDIFRMIKQTGVRAVSVARGGIGNPWIFSQACDLADGRLPCTPNIEEQQQVLLTHFRLAMKIHGENSTGRQMRKFGIKFSQHHPQPEVVARAFIAVKSLADWQEVLDVYYKP